jgi:hypothetical protein
MRTPEEHAAYMRGWRKKNPEKARAFVRNAEAKKPAYYKRQLSLAHLRRTYGLSPEQYEALKTKDNGLCPICLKPGEVVDHDHASGKVRGWLCHACNKGLGFFRDNPTSLRQAAAYLERYL